MITGEYTWSLTVWIGLPVLIVVLALSVWLTVKMVRLTRSGMSEPELGWISAGGSGLVALGAIAVLGLGYVPWAQPFHEYHALNEVEGTVETTSTRLLTNKDGVAQRYVIKFAESPELFGCDDSRCTQATKGKSLRLLCTREWVYQATSGWACRYGQAE